MKVEDLPLSAIKPYEKNPRKNDGAVDGVAESIKQFGFQQPIVVDSKNVIVVGHTRYKAAQKLGLETVPCVRADQLTKEQVKAYRILDNKLNELAGWDFSVLSEELKTFQFDFEGFNINLPSFDISDLFKEPSPLSPNTTTNVDEQAEERNVSREDNCASNSYEDEGEREEDPVLSNSSFYLIVEAESSEEMEELYQRFKSEGLRVRKGSANET